MTPSSCEVYCSKMESLCNFSCCFDVKKDILSFVRSLRDDLPAEEECSGSSNGNYERSKAEVDVKVRIVGQERFNEVLFVWDDVSTFSNDEVTHVGLYDAAKQKNSVLFVHDGKLNIVSCTMNPEHSMIAYVTLDDSVWDDAAQEMSKQAPPKVYRAFLAEIFPQHRIFDLNVERTNLLRVQFLWNRQPKDRDATSRESKLLFLLHKESIGLYTLSLARTGNKGVMMSGPPKTSQVLKQFVWAQWDVATQRLFVVLMRPRPGEQKPTPVLRCLEFSSKTSSFAKILEVILPFPIKLSNKSGQYSDIAPCRTISESSFNMEVLYQSNGSFCVCYQHPTKPRTLTPSTHLSYPDLSMVYSTERLSVDSDREFGDGDVEHPSSSLSKSTASSDLDSRRRAVSDISDLSFTLPPHHVRCQMPIPELSRDSSSSSVASVSRVPPSPLNLSSISAPHLSSPHSSSPFSNPFTPRGVSAVSSTSPMMWGERELPSPVPSGEKQDLVDLNYSVLILHHMTVLHCSVPQIPREIAENTKLYFTPLEGYILVYSPGHLMHLLNVSPEVVPCLHIAFHGPLVPITPLADNVEESIACWDNWAAGLHHPLTHFNREKTANTSGDCIFNVQTGKVFKVSINKDSIPQLLVQANCHSVKLALIHLVTVHLRDSVLIQKVMKELSLDVTDLDLSELMAEHLMGATFSATRRQFDRETLRLLQFTNTDTTRGQLVETTDGERLASFRLGSYNAPPVINFHKNERVEPSISLWENLEQRLSGPGLPSDSLTVNKPGQRFHPRTIELEILKQRAQSLMEGGLARQSPTQRTSFLKKMAASARRVMTPSKKSVITMQPERDASWVLMEVDTSLPDSSQDTILSLTLERLVAHLERFSEPSVSREKMMNMAQEYLSCQLQQVKQLILLMLHSCGYPDPRTIPRSHITLSKKPPPRGYQLFHLIGRFFLAVQSVCFPVPPGFQTFFTIQGFRCLEPSMFLQYVDHGVLRLTEEFITRLLQEVPDDMEEQVHMKMQIISRLPKVSAVPALQRWNHPISMQYLAQQYVADTLKEEGARLVDPKNRPYRSASQNSQGSDGTHQSSVASTFPPLSTLLRLLEAKDPKVGSTSKSPDDDQVSVQHQLDPRLVEKVALRQTVERYGSDLSAVSF